MPDDPTPNLGLTLPTVGADSGNWGQLLNQSFITIDNLFPQGKIDISRLPNPIDAGTF